MSDCTRQADRAPDLADLLADLSAQLGALRGSVEAMRAMLDIVAQRGTLIALPDGVVMLRTLDGFVLLPAEDERLLFAACWDRGLLEPGTRSVLQALLAPGDNALDIGANVGLHTLAMARAVGPGGHVWAVEPLPRAAQLLRRTLAACGLDGQVTVLPVGAGETNGRALLHLGGTTGHSSLLPRAAPAGNVSVDVRRMDDLLPRGTALKVAKVDVEGVEPQVWRGMSRIRADNPDLALVVEFGLEHLAAAGIRPADWLGLLAPAGTAIHAIEESGERLCRRVGRTFEPSMGTVNLLLTPETYAMPSSIRIRDA